MLLRASHIDGFRRQFISFCVPVVSILQIPNPPRPAFLEIAQPLSKRDDGSHRTPTRVANQCSAALVIGRGRKHLPFMAAFISVEVHRHRIYAPPPNPACTPACNPARSGFPAVGDCPPDAPPADPSRPAIFDCI